MIVDGIRLEEHDDHVRLVAGVSWEDRERADETVWFAVPSADAGGMRASGDAFLVGCSVLAQQHGERRLRLTAPTCPRLLEGTATSLAWLRHWFHPDASPLQIEAPPDTTPTHARSSRSALCLTGGVDSLYVLHRNRSTVPPEHPHRFAVGLAVDGVETYRSLRQDEALRGIAAATGLVLLRPSTNLRSLHGDGVFWSRQWLSAVLASVAHAVGGLSEITIAASRWVGDLLPYGSHPLVDHGYSGQMLQVLHAGVELDRLRRLRAIADWTVAQRYLRVCTGAADEWLNCGRCRKCVMTMLALVGLDALPEFETFPTDDLDADLVAAQRLFDRTEIDVYQALVPDLEAVGRHDLAEAVRHLDRDFHTWDDWRALAVADIDAALPPGAPFLLADEGRLDVPCVLGGRRRFALWEPDTADMSAAADALVDALRGHAATGVRHVVVGWPAMWWLDAYPGLASWLERDQRLVAGTERVRVYELAAE